VPRRHSRHAVTIGEGFKLADHAPGAHAEVDKDEAHKRTEIAIAGIADLQNRLVANQTWSVLAVFQGMDTAGKDGTIDHVFSGVNSAGMSVTSFKQPSPQDLLQDFLWRVHQHAPPAGHIGVFNRSHYEDVLVPRVHPETLHLDRLPKQMVGPQFWDHRLEDIAHFEQLLARRGTLVRKFFLHISKTEQRNRLLERLDQPDKTWKFQPTDLSERGFWDEYQHAYQTAISATATPHAPWYIVPADHKWYARMVVAEVMLDTLEALDLQIPNPAPNLHAALDAARAALEAEGKSGA